MRYLNLMVLLLAFTTAHAGPFAPAAGQPGSTAIGKDSSLFGGWASAWQDYVPGAGVDPVWQTPGKALGAAVGDSFDVVSLGEGGRITLRFDRPIADGVGADFAVFENSFSDTFLELAWVEVSSDGSQFFRFSNISFTPAAVGAFGTLDPTDITGYAGKYRQGFGTPFDLQELTGISGLDLNAVRYVRLLDISGDGSALDDYPLSLGGAHPIYDPYPGSGSAGFDLDAIGVINQAPASVPLPPALWLFGMALMLLGALRRNDSVNNNQRS